MNRDPLWFSAPQTPPPPPPLDEEEEDDSAFDEFENEQEEVPYCRPRSIQLVTSVDDLPAIPLGKNSKGKKFMHRSDSVVSGFVMCTHDRIRHYCSAMLRHMLVTPRTTSLVPSSTHRPLLLPLQFPS